MDPLTSHISNFEFYSTIDFLVHFPEELDTCLYNRIFNGSD